jgi:hypothetical protein
MLQAVRWTRWGAFVALLGGLCLVGSASAYQTLPADARINEWSPGGLPGTDFNTPPEGVDYDAVGAPVEAHDGELHVGGTVPTLNYHTPSAPTTNVNFNFVPDLDFTLKADYLNTTATLISGNDWKLDTTFATPDDSSWDLILTDPGASDAEVLRADLIAGTFNSSPVEALTATATIDITAVNKNQIVTAFAFLDVDPTSPYASLFTDTEYVGFSLSQVLNWEIGDADGEYDFDDIAAAILSPGILISFTAEADGAVFGISSSKFTPIPEPGTGLLVGLGLVLLGLRRR